MILETNGERFLQVLAAKEVLKALESEYFFTHKFIKGPIKYTNQLIKFVF